MPTASTGRVIAPAGSLRRAADFEIARQLEIPLNCPLAVVDRSLFEPDETLILETRGYYRGDFVKIGMRLK